jgi:hypothetical protein
MTAYVLVADQGVFEGFSTFFLSVAQTFVIAAQRLPVAPAKG